ncbi:MAG: type III pantothenate kinase [Saprospiraceae bacterium]|nr:type III pantothenate kinase [Saprospiraceae bacterium]
MRQRLCIDLGNSRAKLAIFHDRSLHNYASYDLPDTDHISGWLKEQEFDSLIYSTVLDPNPVWLESLKDQVQSVRLTAQCKLPVKLDKYETPHTLGSDRIAALCGAVQLHLLDASILIVNAGTCMTYDVINTDGQFLGGNISPGLEMRYLAMHKFTSALPLVHPLHPGDHLLGRTTQEAIENGGYFGLIFEIENYFSRLSENYPGLKCVLTGGNAHKLVNRLKIDIFADPYLLLKGLNYILEINESD